MKQAAYAEMMLCCAMSMCVRTGQGACCRLPEMRYQPAFRNDASKEE